MKNYSVIILLLLSSFSIYAEESLSHFQAREAALSSSVELKKLNLSLQSSKLDKQSFYFRYLPSLSANISAALPFLETPEQSGEKTILDKLSSSAGLGLTEQVTLFDGGKTKIAKELLNLQTASLEYQQIAAIYSLLDSVDTAFYNGLEAEAALEAAKLNFEISSTAEEGSEIKYNNGMLSRSDYLRAKSEKIAGENSVIEAERNLMLAILKLTNITGLKEIAGIEKIDFSLYETFVEKLSALNNDDIEQIYKNIKEIFLLKNPQQNQAALTLRRAEKNLSSAKRNYFPTISASASGELSYALTDTGASDPLNYSGRFSLGATLPLDFWVTANNVEKEKFSLESARLDYQSALDDFNIEIRSALYDLTLCARSILSSRASEEYATLRLETQRELFNLKSASLSELLDASAAWTTQTNSKIRAEFNFYRSLSKIRSLCVIENEEDIFLLF
jgi:outer membrane protein